MPGRDSRARRWWERWGFGLVIFLVGVAGLARSERYFGSLLRGWDAQFYYACAHSLVFDRDLDITNNLEATPYAAPFDRDHDGALEAVPRDESGRIRSFYPIGLSLIEVPFLALGRCVRGALAVVGISSPRPAGYSEIEIFAVALGLLALFACGAQLLCEMLRPYVPSPWRECALISAWFGTSLFYYSAIFPFMAHAVGFTLVVATVCIGQFVLTRSPRYLLLLGVALGGLFLVRPQQLTILLPLLLVLHPVAKQPARLWVPWMTGGAGALAALAVFQAWAYSHLTGEWTPNAYASAGVGFDWLHPALWTVSMSPTRGLLWISPVVLLAAAGYAAAPLRQLPPAFVVFAIQALMQIYLIACWAYPEQGDSFGARMWAECAAVVACGVGLLYRRSSAVQNLFVSAALLACLVWTNRLLFLYVAGRLRP